MSLPGDRGASAEDKAAFDPAQGQAVWRRLRVCGGTSLRALHDRILQPALGWCRRYHSYYFTDVTDGSQFGPEDEGRIDEMHRQMFGEVFLDDRRYALADLVAQPGDRLRMEYDLGDHWQCILEVEDVVPDAPAFALLGGQACISRFTHAKHTRTHLDEVAGLAERLVLGQLLAAPLDGRRLAHRQQPPVLGLGACAGSREYLVEAGRQACDVTGA